VTLLLENRYKKRAFSRVDQHDGMIEARIHGLDFSV